MVLNFKNPAWNSFYFSAVVFEELYKMGPDTFLVIIGE